MKRLFKNPKIMISAVIAIILAIAVFILLIFSSARFRVIAALYNTLDTELIDNCITEPLTADVSFVINSLKCESLADDSYFSGAGIKISAMADIDNQTLDMKLTPTYLIYAAPSVCIRQRDDMFGLSSPELYDKELVFDTDRPFEGYENSVFQEMTGVDLPDSYADISVDLMKYPSEIKKSYSRKELRKKILEADIKKTASYAVLTTPDEHEYTCESYSLTFTTGEIITVYIDKSGRLRCLNYSDASIYFCGSQNVTDEFCLVIDRYLLSTDNIIQFVSPTDDATALPRLPDDLELTLKVFGTTENYKQNSFGLDKEFTIDADTVEITLCTGNDEILYINGNATFSVWTDDSPICEDLPDEYLYSMNHNDIQNAISMIYGNLQNNQLMKLIITQGASGYTERLHVY